MMIIYDATIIYKNGSSMVLDNCVTFEIKIGAGASVEMNQLACAKTRMLIMNVGEVMAVYKHPRRIWNPMKLLEIKKILKGK